MQVTRFGGPEVLRVAEVERPSHERLEKGGVRGKLVLEVGDD